VLDNPRGTEESGSSILTAEEQLHLLQISKTVARVCAQLKPRKAPSTSAISTSEKMVVRNIVETAQSVRISASHTLRHLALYEKHLCRPSKRRKYTVPYSSCSKGVRGLWLGTCWKTRKLAEDLVSDVVFVSQVAPNEHTRMVVTGGIEKVRKCCEEIKVEKKVHKEEKWVKVLDFCKKNQEEMKNVSQEDTKIERDGEDEKKKNDKVTRKNSEGETKDKNKKKQNKKDENGKGKNKVNSSIKMNCDADMDTASAFDESGTEPFLEEYNRLSPEQPDCANPFEDPHYEYEDSDEYKDEDTANPCSFATATASDGPITMIYSFTPAKAQCNESKIETTNLPRARTRVKRTLMRGRV
jgi:hypothetical protein